MALEQTIQQQDPIDSVGFVRLFAIGAAVLSTVIVLLTTAFEADQVSNWALEIGAILLQSGLGVFFVRASDPFRAPFRRGTGVVVITLALACFVLDEAAQLGSNRIIHDDWGLVIIPFYLFVLANLRPVRELLIAGAVVTAVVVLVAVLTSPFLTVHVSPTARGLVAATSIVPAALGAAVFAGRILRGLRAAPEDGTPHHVPESDEVRLSVQQENIAQLEAGVVPLINAVIAADAVTAADGRRARQLATSLRGALVQGLARGWLEESGLVVTDPDRYADRMTAEQRTTLLGLIGAVPLQSRARPGEVRITGQDRNAVIELHLPLQRRPTGLSLIHI